MTENAKGRTEPAQTLYRVKPGFQHYPWGGRRFIPALFGLPNPKNVPYAEAWIGAHPLLSSQILRNGSWQDLREFLAENPQALLGEKTAQDFGQLPFLLKVLAAAHPLSIQVHPTKAQARAGFQREQKAGIPQDAPRRSYKDENHKPELLVALSDFYALCAFRPLAQIDRTLNEVGELKELRRTFEPTTEGLKKLVVSVLSLSQSEVDTLVGRWVERLRTEHERSAFSRDDYRYWVLRADQVFTQEGNHDRGLLLIPLLNLLRLTPYQGLFLGPGTLHAYLEGCAVEIMANSDNVLRCGLTGKHIDIPELLRITGFEGAVPQILTPQETADLRHVRYSTPAREFELSCLVLPRGSRVSFGPLPSCELALVVEGRPSETLKAHCGSTTLSFSRGDVFFAPAGTTYTLQAAAKAVLFKARVPE